jgi:uncharacterized membrane protein YfcA
MNELLIEGLAGVGVGLCLGLLGAGGSILLVPIIDYLLGDSAKAAIVQALAVVFLIAAFAGGNAAIRRQVEWRAVVFVGLPGMVGSWLGSRLGADLHEPIQMTIFGLIMGLAAWRILVTRPKPDGPSNSGLPKAMATGLAVGTLTGLIGVGGGFLIVPALTIVLGIPIHRAIGTSLLLIAAHAAIAFGGHWTDIDPAIEAEIQPHTVLILGGFGIAGSLFGTSLSKRLDQTTLRMIFGWFLVVVAAIVLFDYASDLISPKTDAELPISAASTSS